MTVPYSCIKTLGEAYDYAVAGQRAAASICPGAGGELAYKDAAVNAANYVGIHGRSSTQKVGEIKSYIDAANNLCAASAGKSTPVSYTACTAAVKAAGTTPAQEVVGTKLKAGFPWWIVAVLGGGAVLYYLYEQGKKKKKR